MPRGDIPPRRYPHPPQNPNPGKEGSMNWDQVEDRERYTEPPDFEDDSGVREFYEAFDCGLDTLHAYEEPEPEDES
jgi:hypothetical protein